MNRDWRIQIEGVEKKYNFLWKSLSLSLDPHPMLKKVFDERRLGFYICHLIYLMVKIYICKCSSFFLSTSDSEWVHLREDPIYLDEYNYKCLYKLLIIGSWDYDYLFSWFILIFSVSHRMWHIHRLYVCGLPLFLADQIFV